MSRPVGALGRRARLLARRRDSVSWSTSWWRRSSPPPPPTWSATYYGWSVVSCLPGAMGDPQTAATGAVMRPATLRRYAREAGFRGVEVLPMETRPGASTGCSGEGDPSRPGANLSADVQQSPSQTSRAQPLTHFFRSK